jgi:hypothetical protein
VGAAVSGRSPSRRLPYIATPTQAAAAPPITTARRDTFIDDEHYYGT